MIPHIKTFSFIILCSIFDIALGQAPGIVWQNTIGGSSPDNLTDLYSTTDGGIVICGSSSSNMSVDKTENSMGVYDMWVVKLDTAGLIQWQNTIGGSGNDNAYSIAQCADGGYILGGQTLSPVSGDKTEPGLGTYDIWVLKLNSTGGIVWQNVIGGSGSDNLKCIRQTSDGGYICGGNSVSGISGDKTEANMGLNDFWVIKLNSSGNIVWQNTIGGSADDLITTITQTTDGGFICGGYSKSGISGDKTEVNIGYNDYWVLKLNSSGSIVWQNTLGGSIEDKLTSLIQTVDGGYIVGGYSNSPVSGDKTGFIASYDYWILKLDVSGAIIWQKVIGGDGWEELNSIQETADGGLLLGGDSPSAISGNKTEPSFGGDDYWVVKTDASGDVIWDKTFGGYLHESVGKVMEKDSGKYYVAGTSPSNISGNKSENSMGSFDYWILKLNNCTAEICNNNDDDCDGLIDDADADVSGQVTWYVDNDNDGYGVSDLTEVACFMPDGFSAQATDCNDADAYINPSMFEIPNTIDDNCDGVIDLISDFFVQADFIEFAINSCGSYSTNSIPPLGYHPNADSFDGIGLGIVVDSDKDGWIEGAPNYCGDYVLPGYPLEGWSIQINDSIWYNTNPNCIENDIPGGNVFYEKNEERTKSTWTGLIEENELEIRQQTVLGDTDLFFITTITLINYGDADLTNIYYLRTIDPDQEVVSDNEFYTFNQIISNPPLDSDALVTGEGLTYGCYLGIGARNPNTRASFGDYGIIGHMPSEVFAGEADYALSGSDEGDWNNSIVFNIPILIAGDSVKFAFAYIFSSDEVEAAMEATDLSCSPSPELCNTLDDNCNGLIDDGIIEIISISAGGPTTFCQGGSVVLTATHTGTTLQWKKDGANIPGATNLTYNVTKKATYTCTTTSACGSATSTGIFVNVQKNPPASITAGGATTFCMGGSVVLTANAGAGLSYQWYKGAMPLAGATNINYTATIAGNFKCRVTKTATGCYKTSNAITVTVPCRENETITNNSITDNFFTLYPNPATNKLTITINSLPTHHSLPIAIGITITDLSGRILYQSTINSLSTELDISNFAAGMYFIKINLDGTASTQKFIKQ